MKARTLTPYVRVFRLAMNLVLHRHPLMSRDGSSFGADRPRILTTKHPKEFRPGEMEHRFGSTVVALVHVTPVAGDAGHPVTADECNVFVHGQLLDATP